MRAWLLLPLVGLLAACDSSVPCDDTIVSRVPSPDGAYEAVYSIHDCGATTRDAAWIRVIHAGASTESVEPIATFDGEISTLPTWQGRTLHIHYGQSKPFRMGPNFENVRVEYSPD